MPPSPRVAVVSGAVGPAFRVHTIIINNEQNRGIGQAIIEKLTVSYSHVGKLIVYAASRNSTVTAVPKEASNSSIEVRPAYLSLTDLASIDALASAIHDEHGACDVLINNAGVYYYSENITAAQREETIAVNFRGTLRVCQTFIPIMRPNGRIVNISSQSGQLHYFSPELRVRFLDPHLTLEQLAHLVDEYSDAAAKGEAVAKGWPRLTYFASKAALNHATRILARDNPNLFINCCCPGWVSTDLGGQAGVPPKTPGKSEVKHHRVTLG
jgi:carbonyl reductase 1